MRTGLSGLLSVALLWSQAAGAAPCARPADRVAGALQDLKQDEIADQKRFPAGGGFQFGSRRSSITAQMRDPHGAIDENHDRGDRRS